MKIDVYKYIGYYNHDRLHTTLEDMAPVDYEKSNLKVSNLGWPEHCDVDTLFFEHINYDKL